MFWNLYDDEKEEKEEVTQNRNEKICTHTQHNTLTICTPIELIQQKSDLSEAQQDLSNVTLRYATISDAELQCIFQRPARTALLIE